MRDVIPAGAPPASLLAHLRDLIAANGGFLSCEAFMAEALYHPQFGYYTRRVPTVGRKGDFSTSTTLHGALGRAVAAWALARRAGLPGHGPWHLIELGAGGGQLAADVLKSLGWWRRRGLRYHIVERSEPLRREQESRLAAWSPVRWHGEIESALRAAGGRAVIFSNEFADAFPCVVLSREGAGGWSEIGVRWDGNTGGLVETSRPWEPPPGFDAPAASSVFHARFLDETLPGQRVEWHRAYHLWLQGWQGLWTAGAMLTVDYGDMLPALYHRRPAGSLRAYFRHGRCTGPEFYQRPGQQDLTADVNFTDLMRWGSALGWDHALCTQADFLRRWLPRKYLLRNDSDPALRFLLAGEGAGGAFQVLEQRPRQNAA